MLPLALEPRDSSAVLVKAVNRAARCDERPNRPRFAGGRSNEPGQQSNEECEEKAFDRDDPYGGRQT